MAIDVAVGIVKIVAKNGIIGCARAAKYALLPLDGESGQQLPTVRHALDGVKLDAMIVVVVQFRNVGQQNVGCWRGGIECEQRDGLARNTVNDRRPVQS